MFGKCTHTQPQLKKSMMKLTSSQTLIQIGRDFLIVEKSKFIHRGAPVSMRPGKHSFFIPSSYSLVESITRRAQEGRTNCHIFVSSEDEYAMYHGYYEIVYGELMLSKQEWGTIPSQVVDVLLVVLVIRLLNPIDSYLSFA